jgi:hypothetical protein
MTVGSTSVVRAVLAGALVCSIAVVVAAPALAGPSGDTGNDTTASCPDEGPLVALLSGTGDGAECETATFFDPDDLLDPDLPALPDWGGSDESDDESDSDEADDESGSDEDTNDGTDGGDSDGADSDDTDSSDSDADETESDERDDEDTDKREPEPAIDDVSTGAAGGEVRADRDTGAGSAVGSAVLPGIGDAVDGAESGLDWTGALAPTDPPEPPGPRDPPADPSPVEPTPPAGPPAADEPPVAAIAQAPDPAGHVGVVEDGGDVAALAFAEGLPSPNEVGWNGGVVLSSLALTLLLLTVLALPVGLLNKAAADHADRIQVLRTRLLVPPATGRRARGTVAVAVAVTAVAGAALLGFLVPAFPFDPSAPAVLVGLAAAFVIVTVAWQGSRLLYVTRWWGVQCRVAPFPGFLLIAVVGVVLSRALGLEPGLVLGTLVAFSATRPLRDDEAGPAVALAATALTAVGALAWILRDPLIAAAGAPGTFAAAALATALTATTAAAAANLAFALVPVSFLPGAALLRWSPAVWAVFACIGGFAFVHLVAGPAAGTLAGKAGPLAVLLGAYLLGTAALWAWLRHGTPWPEWIRPRVGSR